MPSASLSARLAPSAVLSSLQRRRAGAPKVPVPGSTSIFARSTPRDVTRTRPAPPFKLMIPQSGNSCERVAKYSGLHGSVCGAALDEIVTHPAVPSHTCPLIDWLKNVGAVIVL